MNRHFLWFAMVPALLLAGVAIADYPIMNAVADKLVQKYQRSTCEQLWQEKAEQQGRPKPEKEQELVQLLRDDPKMRTAFIHRVASPILNKMFECGIIP